MVQQRNVNRGVKSRDFILPAPINGLNKKDAIGSMQPSYAITMDNYIPLDNRIVLRSGYVSYVKFSGINELVKTLLSYKKPNHNKLLAVYNNKIHDITNPNEIVSFDIVLSNDDCQQVQYKDRLFIMNGYDKPKVFYINEDGSSKLEDWGFTSETLQAERIIAGAVSKEFLWFVEKDTLKAWYSKEAGNIAGELLSFDLAQISKQGGELVAISSWTVDGGQGIDDYTCFFTSEGEVLVYKGSNPNNVNDWSLVGSYLMSKPIGYNCILPYQGDVVVIAEDGYIPMSKALAINNTGQSNIAFSDKIRGLVLDRTSKNKQRRGWQGIIYSKRGYGIFNVPVNQQFEQHVINVNTGAWCKFTGIRSACWCKFEDKIFFGSDNAVYQFDNGYSDNGAEIEGKVEQAFTNFGNGALKKIQLLNPRTKSSTAFKLTIYTNMDFETNNFDYYTNVGTVGNSKWDEVKWSSTIKPIGTKWSTSSATKINNQWIANNSTGFNASIVFKTKTKGNIIEWYDTGVRYETGSGVM